VIVAAIVVVVPTVVVAAAAAVGVTFAVAPSRDAGFIRGFGGRCCRRRRFGDGGRRCR
jgi:hypothetical protein